jgi:hypothetical protein
MASVISAGTTSGTSLNLSGDTSGVLQLASNGSTTAMTIDTSQNVGIGTASPSRNLSITSSGNTTLQVTNSTAGTASSDGFIVQQNGLNTFLLNQEAGILYLGTSNTERVAITAGGDLQFNSGYGSVATAYGCRAWVNFDGTGTPSIRGSGNVSSITDNGTGYYTINFTSNFPDINYSVTAVAMRNSAYAPDSNPIVVGIQMSTTYTSVVGVAGFAITTHLSSTAAQVDPLAVTVAVFR